MEKHIEKFLVGLYSLCIVALTVLLIVFFITTSPILTLSIVGFLVLSYIVGHFLVKYW
jgi:hypothetical protein